MPTLTLIQRDFLKTLVKKKGPLSYPSVAQDWFMAYQASQSRLADGIELLKQKNVDERSTDEIVREANAVQRRVDSASGGDGALALENGCKALEKIHSNLDELVEKANAYTEALTMAHAIAKSTYATLNEETLEQAAAKVSEGDFGEAMRLIAAAERECDRNDDRFLLWARNDLAKAQSLLKSKGLQAEFGNEISELKARLASMRDLHATQLLSSRGATADANRGASVRIDLVTQRIERWANSHSEHLENRAALRNVLIETREQYPELEVSYKDEISDIVAALEQADQEASARRYSAAHETLGLAAKRLHAGRSLMRQHARCSERIGRLKSLVQRHSAASGDTFAPEAAALVDRLAEAERLVAARRHDDANALLDRVSKDGEKLDALLAGYRQATVSLRKVLEAYDIDSPVSLAKTIARARQQVEELARRPGSKAIPRELLDQIEARIKVAEGNPESAGDALEDWAELYQRAATMVARNCAYLDLRREITPIRSEIESSPDPIAKIRLQELDRSAALADRCAVDGNFKGASAELERIMQWAHAVKAELSRAKEFRERLEWLRLQVTELTDFEKDLRGGQGQAAIRDLREHIDPLDKILNSPERNLDLVAAMLNSAFECHRSAKTTQMAAMPGHVKGPAMDECLRLLQTWGRLDEWVQSAGPDVDAEFLRMAIAILIKQPVEKVFSAAEGPTAIELKRIYKALSSVPEAYRAEIQGIELCDIEDGSGYNQKTRAIQLGVSSNETEDLCNKDELPGAAAGGYLDLSGPPPPRLEWHTLHESGHAVADFLRLEKTLLRHDIYGGWCSHTLLDVAAVVAGQFDCPGINPLFVVTCIQDPNTATPPETDEAIAAAAQICDWVRNTECENLPWKWGDKAAKALKEGGLEIDGRIYHEAYPGDWHSYRREERKRGITGYQFRSPAEWFAEAYAAYGSGKLRPPHPAYGLIQELNT